MKPCKICLSPYRDEIIELRKKNTPYKDIYKKYSKLMDYKAPVISFNQLVAKHIKQKHNLKVTVIPNELKKTVVNLEAFAQRMLELGTQKLDGMEAKDISFNDVLQAQKVVLESKKLKLTEDAMVSMMRKMFAPPEVNVIEGTVV